MIYYDFIFTLPFLIAIKKQRGQVHAVKSTQLSVKKKKRKKKLVSVKEDD